MLLKELYRRLAFGELSNLSMAKNGVIDELKREAIIVYADEALLKLYSRFVLARATHEVVLTSETMYDLDPEVLKVIWAKGQDDKPVPINDRESKYSIFTPSPGTIEVTNRDLPEGGLLTYLSLMCQIRHPLLDSDPETEIVLHASLEAALQSYVAHKVYTFMGGQDHLNTATVHLANYEAACGLVTEQDLVNSSSATTNTNFQLNGWK